MILEIEKLSKSYRQSGGGFLSSSRKMVLEDVSLKLSPGEVLGLVGESGAGKSTLARLILGLEKPDSGHIKLAGRPAGDRQNRRKHVSAVFQDYSSSINPAYTVFEAIAEPLFLAGAGRPKLRVEELMTQVGLPPELLKRRPHELSGGQTQRVCLARALASEPSLIILDEALNSLDVPSQVNMLELLTALKETLGTAFLFISHDLQSVAWLCDRAVFLKSGRLVAESPVSEISTLDQPYVRRLLASAMPF